MKISFRQMTLFLALSETGSVSAAAKRCHVTQPTASMQLKEISEAVGVPLYEVISKKVYLTDAGNDLANVARNIGNEWGNFQQRIDATKGLVRGQLRVALVSTAKYFVPRLLGSFCAKFPDIDIALEVLNRDGVVQRLRDNRDDLYIMSLPPSDIDLEDHILMPNPLVMIASQTHPLAQRKSIRLATLADERFILRERGSGTRMTVDRYFKSQKFKPNLRLELGSNEAIKEAVAGNLGISVLSRYTFNAQANVDSLVVLPVVGFPLTSHWHVVTQRGKQLSPIASVFREHLLAQSKLWARKSKW